MHGGAFSTVRLMHNRGLCNVWLRIMGQMNCEGMIDAASQARLSTQCACKSSGDPLPKDKQGTHALVAFALVLVITSVQLFPSYLLAGCLYNSNLDTFEQCQVWHAEQCSDASIVLVAAILQGQGQVGVHASGRFCQSL